MPNFLKPLAAYADFPRQHLLPPAASPGEQTRELANYWADLSRAMASTSNHALYDVASLTVSRWEFLGRLYQGCVRTTNFKQALAYERTFLRSVNPNYVHVEEVLARPELKDRFDFFTLVRNQPLHGRTTAAIATSDNTQVVSTYIGFSGIAPAAHLTIDADGGLHVDCTLLYEELRLSMHSYAEYLDADTDIVGGRTPRARWLRGFWACHKPQLMHWKLWMTQGEKLGIPT